MCRRGTGVSECQRTTGEVISLLPPFPSFWRSSTDATLQGGVPLPFEASHRPQLFSPWNSFTVAFEAPLVSFSWSQFSVLPTNSVAFVLCGLLACCIVRSQGPGIPWVTCCFMLVVYISCSTLGIWACICALTSLQSLQLHLLSQMSLECCYLEQSSYS